MEHPAYLDTETWSELSRDILRANNITLATTEIEMNDLVDQCASCGEVGPVVDDDKCPKCGSEGNMVTGRILSHGNDFFVSYR